MFVLSSSERSETLVETEYRLTTIDNPYNPFTDFEQWFMFDVEKGYNTCGYLARLTADISDELTEQETTREINRAIDEIIKYDFMNIYKRVTKDDEIIVEENPAT